MLCPSLLVDCVAMVGPHCGLQGLSVWSECGDWLGRQSRSGRRHRYAKQTISDLLMNRLDISHLVISKSLSKSGEEYAAKQVIVPQIDPAFLDQKLVLYLPLWFV